jgi:hypothetical protein
MKRLFIMAIFLASLFAYSGPAQGSNVTQRTVYLQERMVVVKFVNRGVDAYWSEHILDKAVEGLPVLEELMGVPLPEEVKTVEIYGEKNVNPGWAVGYNDGNLVALETDHPKPIYVFHELVHFWTIFYDIPWPLCEGYCNLYADLCAARLGLHEVGSMGFDGVYVDWQYAYQELPKFNGKVALNSFDYNAEGITEVQMEYFYLASTVIMHQFYETVGEETLKEINRQVAETNMDSDVNGVGIVQYLGITKQITGVNYAGLFMPVILTEWEPGQVNAFEEGVSRYYAISEVLGITYTDEQMKQALQNLVRGRFPQFQLAVDTIVDEYYQKLEEEKAQPVEYEIIPAEKKTGFFHNRLLLVGLVMLVVVVILLVYSLSKLAKEEEVFEWETPGKQQQSPWAPSKPASDEKFPFEEKVTKESTESEERPEIPDLEELTK